MERYFEINENGNNIRCKLYEKKQEKIKKVIIFLTGFAGHKDNSTCEKFAGRVLDKYKGCAVVTFNWPCHGDDVKKKLMLSDCLTYLRSVIGYAKNTLCAEELYCNATSFGAYMTMLYIRDNGNPFRKTVLRAPAVNMYELLTRRIMKEDELERLMKGKTVSVGFDRKIEVNADFIGDLQKEDIKQADFIDFADDILIIQGTKDEVVDRNVVQQFAEDNVIEYYPIENADHRFQAKEHVEAATKLILGFFML